MSAVRQSAALLRRDIEEHLAKRVPEALTPRLRLESERFACGLAGIDAALCGGVPVGAITELVGAECSGRTTMALAYAAASIQAGNVAAWIDVDDVLDPECAAMSGVDWKRLLWVRCGQGQPLVGEGTGVAAGQALGSAGQSAGQMAQPLGLAVPQGGCGSPHPRSEGIGMPQAIQDLLLAQPRSSALPARRRDKSIGTPGVPNRPLPARAIEREEQVATDRLPPRRGERVAQVVATPRSGPRCAEPQATPHKAHGTSLVAVEQVGRRPVEEGDQSGGRPQGLKPRFIGELYGTHSTALRAGSEAVPLTKRISAACDGVPFRKQVSATFEAAALTELSLKRKRMWTPLDQALRATDLLLQSGGFSLLVLDLGSTPAEMAWRIPLATWFRYRAACARTQTSLLLLTRRTCAKSSAELVVRMEPGRMQAEGGVLTGIAYRAERERQRFQAVARNNVVSIRKPPQPERPGVWQGQAAWAL